MAWLVDLQRKIDEATYWRFGPGGSLDRRVKSLRAPAQMGWRGIEHKRWGKPCIILHQGCRS
jgi:hypothetical protein